jgi:hypothetical protein
MICATVLMPPIREYLLFELHPAIRIEMTEVEDTAVKYKIPILILTADIPFPYGSTAYSRIVTVKVKMGAIIYTHLSTADGVIASLPISFTASTNA